MNTTYRSLSTDGHTFTIASGARQVAISSTNSNLVTVYTRRDAARFIQTARRNGYTSQRLDASGYPVSR